MSKPPCNLHKLHAFLLASCLDHRAGRLVATAQAVVSSLPLQNPVCEENDGTDQKSKDHRNKTHQKRSGKASEGRAEGEHELDVPNARTAEGITDGANET